jgi:YD repeat-containing protein
VRYTYYVGSNGRLSRVTDPAGGVTTYTYGEYAQSYYWNEGMLSITDARGITYLQNQYDTNGRVAKQILADGGTYTFAYTLAGQTVTQTNVTDPRGNVTIYRMNGSQHITQVERPGSMITNYEREAGTNKLTAVVDRSAAGRNLPTTATGTSSRSRTRRTIRPPLPMSPCITGSPRSRML